MDTQGSHTGTLKRIDVDKTPSDLAVLGPLGQRPHTEYEISFIFLFSGWNPYFSQRTVFWTIRISSRT